MARIEARSRTLRQGWRYVSWMAACAALVVVAFIAASRPSVTVAATALRASGAEPPSLPPRPSARPVEAAPVIDRLAAFDAERNVATEGGPVTLVPTVGGLTRAPKVMTMLHGMCSEVAWSCEAVKAAVPNGYLLTCPTGNRTCEENGEPDWGGEPAEKAKHIATSVDRALSTIDVGPRSDGDVLIGFSRGAFVARDVAYATVGRYRGLVLIGAALTPDPELLRKSGVRRVVLAAGDHDTSAKTMRAAHARLVAAGLEAKYVSLGPVWHTLPPDTAKRLAAALAWVAET